MLDIAKYGIAIDARQVKDAEKALDGMGAAGARAEDSLKKTTKASQENAAAIARSAGVSADATRQTNAFIASLEREVATFGKSRAEILAYDAALLGATKTQRAQIAALIASKQAQESQVSAAKAAQEQAAKTAREQAGAAKNTGLSLQYLAGEAAKAYGSLTVLNGIIVSSISATKEYTAAINGLASVARYSGQDINATLGRATALTRDGLLSTSEAALALKNLLSRGFSTDQAVQMIERFKDSAAFGRQASLEFGQAVVSATEGIKNENSILVDNAGVTKNVSQMWKEYAAQIGVSVGELTQAQKRQAEYNGILAETEGQLGNAAIASDGLVGAQARMNKATKDAATVFGQLLTPAVTAAANAATILLEKGVNPAIFGMEALGIKAGETAAKVGLFFSFLSDPKRWSGGIAGWINSPEYKAQIAALEKLSDEMLTASAGRISGATGPEAPMLGPDSGKRREDAKEAAKEAKERITDYQRLIESSRERIAVLQAELAGETKLTEGEKWAAKMLEEVHSGKLKLTAAEREHLEALAGAVSQMSRYQAQQAEQREGVKRLAEEERKRNEELARGVAQAEADLEALKIRTDLMKLGVTATEDITVALLEAHLASADFTTATYEEIEALERRIGIAREAAQVAREGRQYEATQRAAKDAAQTAAREWERASEQIAQSLTDNIMRGGKSAGELLQDYFRTLVLRPVIQGVVQAAMGAPGGQGGILQTGANLLGLSSAGFGSLGTMASYGTAAATGGVFGGASQGALLAAQTAEFGLAGATATAEALGGVASSLGGVSAALGPIGVGLTVLAASGVFEDEGDAMRTGNWQGALGATTRSTENKWFSDADMGAALDKFTATLAKSEAGVIKALDLSRGQIDSINKDIEALSGKQYDFGMEHQAIPAETFAQIAKDRFGEVFDTLGAGLGDLVRESGATYDEVMATVGGLVQVSKGFAFIDGDLRGLERATVDAAGGVAQLAGATSFYIANFYTEGERLAATVADLVPQFAALGYDHVPKTRAEFREMVEALDLTTEAGKKTRGQLLALADDVAAVTDPTTVKPNRTEYHPTTWTPPAPDTSAVDAARQAAAEYSQKLEIQRGIYEATGDAAGLAAVEEEEHRLALAALPPALRDLQKELWAAEKAAAFVKSAQQQQIELLELQGNSEGALALRRAQELDAMDASLRPMQQRIYALQDEKAAAQLVADAEKQRSAAQQAAVADSLAFVDRALAALSRAVDEERKAATAANARMTKELEGGIQRASDSVARLTGLSATLRQAVDGLQNSLQTPIVSRQLAQAQISAALAIAKAGGALPEESTLRAALNVVAQPSEDLYSSFVEYQRDQRRTANDIRDLSALADLGLGDAKVSQRLLEGQLAATTAGYAAEMGRLDGILTNAQAQVAALKGIDNSVLSVAAAIGNLSALVGTAPAPGREIFATPSTIQGASGTPSLSTVMALVDAYDAPAALRLASGTYSSAVLAAAYNTAHPSNTVTATDVEGLARQLGIPGFATGINAGILPADTLLQAHGGERITPAVYVDKERNDRAETNALLSRLLAANEALRARVDQLTAEMEQTQRNTKRHADLFENVTEGGEQMRVDVVATV